MTLDHFREYRLSIKEKREDLSFNENTLAFNMFGEVFVLYNMMTFYFFNLKCDTEKSYTLMRRVYLINFHFGYE